RRIQGLDDILAGAMVALEAIDVLLLELHLLLIAEGPNLAFRDEALELLLFNVQFAKSLLEGVKVLSHIDLRLCASLGTGTGNARAGMRFHRAGSIANPRGPGGLFQGRVTAEALTTPGRDDTLQPSTPA